MSQLLAWIEIETGFLKLKRGLQIIEDDEVHAFVNDFARLQNDFEPVQAATVAKKRAVARSVAPDFNLFRILGVENLEDNTHSPFLAELLNPQGTHGQGSLFLRAFLEIVGDKFGAFPVPESPPGDLGWKISRERFVGDGYLDILIANEDLGCLYVIENKIYAPEQPKQIKRYQQWLNRQESYPQRALIFLTPTGRRPLSGKAFCLSYQEDIKSWLESVFETIEAPRVQETVGQYLALLAVSREETMGYEDRVLEFIGQPENVKTALQIASYVEKLKAKAHWQFWSMFNSKLDELYQESTFRNAWELSPMSKKDLNKSWVGCQIFPRSAKVSEKNYLLNFAFQQFPLQNKGGLYYGIRWMVPANAPEDYTSPELDLLMERLRQEHIKSNPPNWPAWFTLGFPVLGEKFLIKMTNEPDAFVDQLVKDFWRLMESYVKDVETVNKAITEEEPAIQSSI